MICEKPLGVSLSECREAIEAVRRAQVLNAICFNYRRLPAVSLMHNLVKRGEIGDVLLWRGVWLSDEFLDPLIPFDWRFDRALGGTTIADLGSHLVDLAHWVVGSIAEVCAQSQTFTTARRDPDGPRSINVSVDEASSALLRFSAGAQGSFEVARTCARRPCDFIVEVNGSCGSLIFDYTRLTSFGSGYSGTPMSCTGCAPCGLSTRPIPMRVIGGPSVRAWATARVSSTFSQTCSPCGLTVRGNRASRMVCTCRRSARCWNVQSRSDDGYKLVRKWGKGAPKTNRREDGDEEMIKIGNAPVSYGAFEVTVGHDPDVPSAESVLDAVASAGYEGIDLGPIGYLGLGPDLQRALTSRGLALTGGYLEIDVSDDETPSKGFAELDLICDQFDVVSEDIEKRLKPRPTVALVTPGRPPQAESDEDWARDRARSRRPRGSL